jgi:hypothetical protein
VEYSELRRELSTVNVLNWSFANAIGAGPYGPQTQKKMRGDFVCK